MREGALLRTLAGKPAALVTFLEGVWIRRPQPRHCLALGQAHGAAASGGPEFRIQARAMRWASPAGGRSMQRFAAARRRDRAGTRRHHRAGARPSGGRLAGHLPQGVIHADLFPDNVFFLGDKLSGLIDFYFACNDALAYDIAIALNAWCFEADHAFNVTKGQALLKGYQSARAPCSRPSATRCRCWRAARRCASC